jgi:hypothetical protein
MLARLRGFRLLALLLLIGSPGLGGSLVQALHPCMAEMPWLAAPDGAGHGAHDHGESGSGSQAAAECHCIGSCAAGAPIVSPAVAPPVRVALQAAGSPAPGRPVAVPAAIPSDRLPPATAPPTLA